MTLKLYNVTRKLEACQGPNLFPNITNKNTQYVYYPAFKFKCKFSEHFYEQFFLKKSVRPTVSYFQLPVSVCNFFFFGYVKSAKNLLINCWWNWLDVFQILEVPKEKKSLKKSVRTFSSKAWTHKLYYMSIHKFK